MDAENYSHWISVRTVWIFFFTMWSTLELFPNTFGPMKSFWSHGRNIQLHLLWNLFVGHCFDQYMLVRDFSHYSPFGGYPWADPNLPHYTQKLWRDGTSVWVHGLQRSCRLVLGPPFCDPECWRTSKDKEETCKGEAWERQRHGGAERWSSEQGKSVKDTQTGTSFWFSI